MRNWKLPLFGAVAGAAVAGAGYGLEGLDPLACTAFGIVLMAGLAWRVHSRRQHEAKMKVLWQRYLELAAEQAKLEEAAEKA